MKEHKFDREVDNKLMELGILSLNPSKDSFLRVLKRALEEGISLVVVPLISFGSSKFKPVPWITFVHNLEHKGLVGCKM